MNGYIERSFLFDPSEDGAAESSGTVLGDAGDAGPTDGGHESPDEQHTPPQWLVDLGIEDKDILNDKVFKDVPNAAALAKGYAHAQRMIGGEKVTVPGKNATDEDWEAFYKKLGRPDTPDDYEAPEKGLPEGVEVNEDARKKLFQAAYSMGLNKQQAARLYRHYAESVGEAAKQSQEAAQQRREAALNQLKSEFGEAFDQNIAMAQNAIRELGGEELLNSLVESGYADDPAMVRFAHNVGRMLATDEITGGGRNQGFVLSPDDARRKINSMLGDETFQRVYRDKNHPGHAEAVREMQEMYAKAFPDQ